MKRILVFALAVACAAALAQGPGPGPQGGPGGGQRGNRMGMQMGMQRGGGLQLINRPDVQKELAITEAQKTEIAQLFPQRRGGERAPGASPPPGGPAGGPRGGGGEAVPPPPGGQGGPGAGPRGGQRGDPEQMRARQAEQEKKLQAILNSTQWKRFNELRLQNEGANALMREAVATELGLTQDQKNKLQEIQRTSMEGMREAMAGAREGGEFNREEMQAMMEKFRKDVEAKMLAVLTDAQRTKWTAMQGKPFTFTPIGR